MIVAASVKVGDAKPEHSMDQLGDDLSNLTHTDAFEHYKLTTECSYTIFANEPYRGKVQDRAVFEEALVSAGIAPEKVATYLAEWDEATRPVACLHWWELPELAGRA
jgi:hypothetical protein